MKVNKSFRLLPIAAALIAAYGTASAQNSAEVQALISPESSVSAGVGSVNNNQNAKKFGQYNGMSKGGGYGLFDIDMVKRENATGTWMTLQGRDLG
ncbi:MAG: MtrB/PioB family outer membrane beta-barrel protein, partial [Sulfuritalea sp.]|nr:MtrB/PioB family outer membrane beta-barrel protein [Sulfuritalea sp.]